ncbi:aminoacyl tRNA synthase complex-interacting multifunctional protein 1 [Engraulis encrasicolus]|uniref:aminoacyl tRNA synthase complex-interacting multifunctional protein 1 n=1 Tax=Engraulis encrasicolus TaxID=184585 RepID=UPI002FD3170E
MSGSRSGSVDPYALMCEEMLKKEQETIMEFIRQKMLLLGEKAMLQKSVREEKKLLVENAKLKEEIEQLKKQLQENQRRKAAKLKVLAEAKTASPTPPEPAGGGITTPSASPAPRPAPRAEARKKKGACRRSAGGQESELAISQLDLRVGRILSARQHPEAESLCIQEVDVGDGQPRTAVSRAIANTHTEETSEVLCVCVCNGRAVRVRGVLSKVHILCAVNADSAYMEMIAPPTSAQPGDRVTFNAYPGEPDRELSPRVFGRLQPDLTTDARGVACYKGVAFEVKGKGLCRAASICNGSIK